MDERTPHAPEPAHFRIYGDYAGTEPAFYQLDDFPWAGVLQQNWKVIRREFEEFFYHQGHALKPNFVPDPVPISGWLGVTFLTYLRRYEDNCRHFPRTVRILESIPNLASAFINLLEPHSSLPPHYGDSNTAYRVHLGLIIPDDVDRCGMQVEAERVGWREGEVLIFNDARKHFVWNDADRPRVILVCDVMKPQYGGASPRACGKVFGSIAITFLQTRLPLIRWLPAPMLRALHAAASLPFQIYLAVSGRRHGAAFRAAPS
jgi:Aspartyl/Asparaginyl beta-hydroxylase